VNRNRWEHDERVVDDQQKVGQRQDLDAKPQAASNKAAPDKDETNQNLLAECEAVHGSVNAGVALELKAVG